MATPLIECHAHLLPDGALACFPDGGDPRYVTAERRVLGRMLEAHEACGVTRALVNPSDSPSGGHRYLDDPVCGPLLAAAEALGRPLFIHPSRDLPAGEHYDDVVMSFIVGRPSQTAVCAARLIFTGTLDRYPGLSLLLAHGGGALPAMAGRLDATWRAYRPGRWQGPDVLTVPPSSYLRRFHVDSNVWSLPALRLLLEVLGPDRILVGNDQPPVWFPLAESLALLGQLDPPAAEREAVRWRNATRLFGLEPARVGV